MYTGPDSSDCVHVLVHVFKHQHLMQLYRKETFRVELSAGRARSTRVDRGPHLQTLTLQMGGLPLGGLAPGEPGGTDGGLKQEEADRLP